MAFEETVPGDLVEASFTDRISLDLGRVLQTLVLAAAALFIAFGLLRPMLRRDPVPLLNDSAPVLAGAAQAPARGLATPEPASAPRAAEPAALSAPVPPAAAAEGPLPPPGVDRPALPAAVASLPAAAVGSPAPDPVERLRRLIEEREEETIEILRSWIEEDEGARP
jgi:flagellar M-ring protein FliF